MNDLPTMGLGPPIMIRLFLASSIAKCKLVLRLLKLSIEISVESSSASNVLLIDAIFGLFKMCLLPFVRLSFN